MIKRTKYSYRHMGTVWVSDPWGEYGASPFSETVFESGHPTHSPVLGPDGRNLEYEPRQPVGFIFGKNT